MFLQLCPNPLFTNVFSIDSHAISTVCVATIREFSDTLTDDVKTDPKKIEEAFKEYCLTAKSKQQRLVSHKNTLL